AQAGTDGSASVKASAEKEFDKTLGFTPKLGSEVELTKDGPKLNVGGSLESPSLDLKNLKIRPAALAPSGFSYDPKTGWSGPKLGISAEVSAAAGTFKGLTVTPKLKVAFELEPEWAEIGRLIAEKGAEAIASGGASFIAAAVGAPLVWLVVA